MSANGASADAIFSNIDGDQSRRLRAYPGSDHRFGAERYTARHFKQWHRNMGRPVEVASSILVRAEKQTDSEALIPVAVVGPPPVAIRRAAVPGRIVPTAASDHAIGVFHVPSIEDHC